MRVCKQCSLCDPQGKLTMPQMCGMLYLLDVYEALMGASAIAATSLLRYILAAVFPLFITPSRYSQPRVAVHIIK